MSARAKGLSADFILADLRKRLGEIQDAFIITIAPPPVRGIGTAGGFKMMVQDKRGRGFAGARGGDPGPGGGGQPDPGARRRLLAVQHPDAEVYADIDRVRAEMLGVPANRVFETLQVYLGSAYVNDFNYLGRTYRVTAQADAPFRDDIATSSI